MNSEAYIHLGQWTNWSDGSLKGARLTMTQSGGAYLIAFLALFVRMAGQHSWGILCYVIFRGRQKRLNLGHTPLKDPLQSIFRNVHVDVSAAWQIIGLGRRRPSPGTGLAKRCTLYTLVAIFHASLFLAAGIFVSKVTDTGKNEVLLRGGACGIWENPASFGLYSTGSEGDILENEAWVAWNFESSSMAGDFSRQCYNTSSSDSALANCNAYAPNLLTWEIEDAACPFDEKMCQNGTTIRLDSGQLDSLHHFGINAPKGDRVKYRRVVQCSPLTREDYVSDFLNLTQVGIGPTTLDMFTSAPQQNAQFQEYRYGANQIYNMTSTYIWNNSTQGGQNFGNMQLPQFLVDAEIYMPEVPDDGTFIGIAELNQTNADVVIYFLLAAVNFMEPVNDPWFQATLPEPIQFNLFVSNNTEVQTRNVYGVNYPAGVMGCTQQFQYCNQDGSKCSPLAGQAHGGGFPQSISAFAEGLDLNTKQQATLNRIQQAAYNQGMYTVAIQPNGLLAQAAIAGTFPPPLPDNQWILEMQHYFLTGLTAMQMQLASFATGPPDATNYQYLTEPSTEDEWMCYSQIVQRSGYSTFSVLGIGIVVGLGCLIVIINLALPSVGKHMSRRRDVEGINRWEEYHHLDMCSTRPEMNSKMHFVEPADTLSTKSTLRVTATDAYSTDQISQHARGSDTPTWTSTYVNDFSENMNSTTNEKSQPRREWLRQMFGSRHDRGSELKDNVT